MEEMNKYLKVSIICFIVAIVAASFISCISCSPKEEAKDSFNRIQNWFTLNKETDQNIDQTITVRIRGFGSEKEKQEQWNKEFPQFGKVPFGVSVSSNPPQIWFNLREDKNGNIVIPYHVLGHEMVHTAKLFDKRITNPDDYISDIY